MPNSIQSAIRERLPYLGLSGVIFLLDRLTKSLIEDRFGVGESLTVISGFFNLTYVRNAGVAFGMLATDFPGRAIVLSGAGVVAAVIVAVYSVRNPIDHRSLQTALALILGGALGNLYDRLSYGYVVDFLEFYAGAYSWPTFNVADSAITMGVALLAAGLIRDEIRSRT